MSTFSIEKLRDALSDPTEPENVRTIAVVYWRSLILLSFVLLATGMFYGYQQFNGVLETFTAIRPVDSRPVASFSRNDLDKTVAAVDARVLRYASLQAAPLTDADPSQ